MALFERQICDNDLPDISEVDRNWTKKEYLLDELSEKYYNKKYKITMLFCRNKLRRRQIKDMKKSFLTRKYIYNSSIQTSKLIMAGIFINCTIIEIYSMIAMIVMNDLSALSTLLGSVLTEGISFAIYSCKAYAETREEQKIALEREINQVNTYNDEEEYEDE